MRLFFLFLQYPRHYPNARVEALAIPVAALAIEPVLP
jgi:hypothetical protein